MSDRFIEAGTVADRDGICEACGEEELGAFDMLEVTRAGVQTIDDYSGCMICLDLAVRSGTFR